MEIYRIKHKPTGLYFQPSKDHNNLSKTGKLYSTNHGWLSFIKCGRILCNSTTKIGKDIINGKYPELNTIEWPKDFTHMNRIKQENPEVTDIIKLIELLPNAKYRNEFTISVNIEDWEKEIFNN